MPSFVLDSSVAISWIMPDEIAALSLLDQVVKGRAIVPTIWLFEVSNVLLGAERAKRLNKAQRHQTIYTLKELPIQVDASTVENIWFNTAELADNFSLTIYDASYLELALRYNIPLATFDKSLQNAAKSINVNVLKL